jgi:hypothetical protein
MLSSTSAFTDYNPACILEVAIMVSVSTSYTEALLWNQKFLRL